MEFMQEEIPAVKEMTERELQSALQANKESINTQLQSLMVADLELAQAIDKFIEALFWLKTNHQNEGSLCYRYKKKKNVHGEETAQIIVSATFKENISESESKTLTKEFLNNQFFVNM